jgi:NAD-dependent dihydropyrimidine dehydrogenase PreA subunit
MYAIDKEKCIGCAICIDYCPVGAIRMHDGKAEINDQCIDCGKCVNSCPQGAISPVHEPETVPRFFPPIQGQMPYGFNFNSRGRGLGFGMGRGLGRGPRDGRGRGRGGGGKRWR